MRLAVAIASLGAAALCFGAGYLLGLGAQSPAPSPAHHGVRSGPDAADPARTGLGVDGEARRTAADVERAPGPIAAGADGRTAGPAPDIDPVDDAYARLQLAFAHQDHAAAASLGARLWEQLAAPGGIDRLFQCIDAEPNAHVPGFVFNALGAGAQTSTAGVEVEAALATAVWQRFTASGDERARDAMLTLFTAHKRLRHERCLDLQQLALHDLQPSVRQRAVAALGWCPGQPGVVDTLCQIASVEAGKMQATALWAMERIDDPRILPVLAAALQSPDPRVRAAAYHSHPVPAEPEQRRGFVRSLHREFGETVGPRERAVLVDRLLDVDPSGIAERLREELRSRPDDAARRFFGAVVAAIDSGITSGDEIRAMTWRLRAAYAYGQ